jgi:hypothetical protein
MGAGGLFPDVKVAGAWRWPPSLIQCRGQIKSKALALFYSGLLWFVVGWTLTLFLSIPKTVVHTNYFIIPKHVLAILSSFIHVVIPLVPSTLLCLVLKPFYPTLQSSSRRNMFSKLIPCFVFIIGIDIYVLPAQTDWWKHNRTCESSVLL